MSLHSSSHSSRRSVTASSRIADNDTFATPASSSSSSAQLTGEGAGALWRIPPRSGTAWQEAEESLGDGNRIRILVLGDPTSGKSAFVKRVCLEHHYFTHVYPNYARFLREYRDRQLRRKQRDDQTTTTTTASGTSSGGRKRAREDQGYPLSVEDELQQIKQSARQHIDRVVGQHSPYTPSSSSTTSNFYSWERGFAAYGGSTRFELLWMPQDSQVKAPYVRETNGSSPSHQREPCVTDGLWVEFVDVGSESSKEARRVFYRDIHGIIIVFDATKGSVHRQETAKKWMHELMECDTSTEGGITASESLDQVRVILVGNQTKKDEQQHSSASRTDRGHTSVSLLDGGSPSASHRSHVIFTCALEGDAPITNNHGTSSAAMSSEMGSGTCAVIEFLEDILGTVV
eukprot:gb/GECG01002487.1/.p1 GENE.gb/GECG01002487.1/~~gb/GECG01002487.1/.p1  ORF type:complete len:402 (+),score=49.90 gb/GECG01002487.1/:1-1206(+)